MGASLWLLPPPGPLRQALETLISETLPKHFPDPVPDFQPHITITSGIPVSPETDFQSLLSSLQLPSPKIQFKRIRYGTAFWTKITLELHKTDSLKDLAVACRAAIRPDTTEQQAREWVEKYTTPAESGEEGFIPHLSLVYWDGDVNDQRYAGLKVGIRSDVYDTSIKCEEGLMEVIDQMGGWEGGKLVLVDTTKKVEEWKHAIIAEREV
ncbi:hypothetical protein ABW20_dc0106429 [Dactylellina cionopaga]|nr:hypothetical protein ABW20_dc0106429 [Dactylellina cionopaga]